MINIREICGIHIPWKKPTIRYCFWYWVYSNVLIHKHWYTELPKFCKWLIFSFFTILFSLMGLPKADTLQWVFGFFKELNFMNNQYLWNSHASKNQLYSIVMPLEWCVNTVPCWVHCPSNCYTVKFCCVVMFNVLINAHCIVGTRLEYWCSLIWIQKVGLQ